MLSLLIISNNPKAKLIQKFIQPLIKTEIGLVADFDDGVNEVFEKSPATVIIQERIAGVACDTVVRYMRQMLGSDAPAFIMLYEGNSRTSQQKGLFKGFADLHQPEETLVTEISSLLERIIDGEQFMDAGLPHPSPPLSVVPAHVTREARIADATMDEELLSYSKNPLSDNEEGQPRILLVEDNLISQQLTLTRLSNLGYKVDIVPNGQKAITVLESIDYDLVIMDWLMPLMDGLEATARIRDMQSNVLNHDVPIIALTSNKEPGDREKCLAAGMNDYLVKPVKKAYLAEVLEKWLKNPVISDSVDSDASEAPSPELDTEPQRDDTRLQDTFMSDEQLAFPLMAETRISDIFSMADADQAIATLTEEPAGSEKHPPKKKPAKTAKGTSSPESVESVSDQTVTASRIQAVGDDLFENKLLKEALHKCENLEQAVTERTLELQTVVKQLKVERAERKDTEEKLKQARITAEAANERLLAKLAERKQELENVNAQLQVEFTEHKDAEERLHQAIIAAESTNEQLQAELAEQKQELEAAAEQLRKDAEEKSKQARITAASANQQLLAELAERKQELESVQEQLQVEFAEHKDAEEKLHQAIIDAEVAREALQAELAERKLESETVAEQFLAERAERKEFEGKFQQTITVAEAANQQLQAELAERKLELEAANEQLQVEFTEHKDAEEKLHQAIIAAEAAKEELQAELAERELESETASEQLQAERAGRSVAEEKLHQIISAAEAANQQLQAECAEHKKELARITEQSHVEFAEHKDAEEKLHQAIIAAESANAQLQAEQAERKQELATAVEQMQIEFTEHKDAEEKLHQAIIAAETANEQLQAELAERKQELAAAGEQLQSECTKHKDAEEKLHQAIIAAEAANEQLQAELAERKQELATFGEQSQSEFTEHKDAEEKLHQAVIAAETANEQLQAELAETKQELATAVEQLQAELAERKQELVTAGEQLQIEFAEHKDAEEKLHRAVIAAESANEQLQTELAERNQEMESVAGQLQAECTERKDVEEKLNRAGIAAESAKEQFQAEHAEYRYQLKTVNEQLQAAITGRKAAEERLHLAEIAAEAAKEHLQAELAKRRQADFFIGDSPSEKNEPLSENAPPEYAEKNRYGSPFLIFLLTTLVLLSCMAGGLYLFKRKPMEQTAADISRAVAPTGTSALGDEALPLVKPSAAPPLPITKGMTSEAKPAPSADSPLPSFITLSGRDSSYPAQTPGWERYVDTAHDVRVYRVAGKIKAIQVRAAKSRVIADSFMQTALREVADTGEYTLISSERKEGFTIQRNSAGPRAKLTVYRMQPSNKISAFVVLFEE
ncbi:MAG: response regulator [Desulfuromonadaceae bacterium]